MGTDSGQPFTWALTRPSTPRLSNPHLARLKTLLFCARPEPKILLLAMCQKNGSSCDERSRSVYQGPHEHLSTGYHTSSCHLQQRKLWPRQARFCCIPSDCQASPTFLAQQTSFCSVVAQHCGLQSPSTCLIFQCCWHPGNLEGVHARSASVNSFALVPVPKWSSPALWAGAERKPNLSEAVQVSVIAGPVPLHLQEDAVEEAKCLQIEKCQVKQSIFHPLPATPALLEGADVSRLINKSRGDAGEGRW